VLIVVAFIFSFLAGIFYQKRSLNLQLKTGKINWSQIRDESYKVISWYLLFRIGLTGGAEINLSGGGTIFKMGTIAIALSILMFIMALGLIYSNTNLDRETKFSIVGHFGSVSIGTFMSAQALLNGIGVGYSSEANAWVAIMELPAVLLVVLFISRGISAFGQILRKNKRLLMLPLALTFGVWQGHAFLELGLAQFLFENIFNYILAYFLFEMGRHAYESLGNIGKDFERVKLLMVGIGLPLLGGTLGTALSRLCGLSLGDSMILGTLAASGSYVAAPSIIEPTLVVVYGHNLEKAKRVTATSLTMVLGITLPFNILVGIQLYLLEARIFENQVLGLAGIATVIIVVLYNYPNGLLQISFDYLDPF